MARLISYLKQKLNISTRIPLPTNLATCLQPSPSNTLASTRNTFPKPSLSRSITLQTNFPETCPVCTKHQCEVDVRHVLVQSVGEALKIAFDKTLKDLKENSDKQIAKYEADLEQQLQKILKLA